MRRQRTPFTGCSPTRLRFKARKRKAREGRQYDVWWKQHHFWCKGLRRRNGRMKQCAFEVRFTHEVEATKATCSFCHTVHIYGRPMTSGGYGELRWMTMEEYDESVPDTDAVEVIETHEGDIVALVSHAKWCHDRSKPLIGCKAVWRGSGDIAWYMPGRRGMWHRCQSSTTARDIALAAN